MIEITQEVIDDLLIHLHLGSVQAEVDHAIDVIKGLIPVAEKDGPAEVEEVAEAAADPNPETVMDAVEETGKTIEDAITESEAPAEEAPVEEAPAPTEEAPIEEVPAEEIPAE